MRGWNWPLIGMCTLIAALPAITIIDTLEPIFCEPNKLATAAAQQNVVVFRCWEFWLNRYQSLGGSLITAAVAGAALLWAAGQLKVSERQSAASAAAALRARAAELEGEAGEIERFTLLDKRIRAMDLTPRGLFRDGQNFGPALHQEIEQIRGEVRVSVTAALHRSAQHPADIGTPRRDEIAAAMREYDEHVGKLSFEVLFGTIGGIDVQRIQQARMGFEDAALPMVAYAHALSEKVATERREVWKQIRRFEDFAVGV